MATSTTSSVTIDNINGKTNSTTITKGEIITSDGTNLIKLTNAGVADDSKIIALDSTALSGLKLINVVATTSEIFDVSDSTKSGYATAAPAFQIGLTFSPVVTGGKYKLSWSAASNLSSQGTSRTALFRITIDGNPTISVIGFDSNHNHERTSSSFKVKTISGFIITTLLVGAHVINLEYNLDNIAGNVIELGLRGVAAKYMILEKL